MVTMVTTLQPSTNSSISLGLIEKRVTEAASGVVTVVTRPATVPTAQATQRDRGEPPGRGAAPRPAVAGNAHGTRHVLRVEKLVTLDGAGLPTHRVTPAAVGRACRMPRRGDR